jgi:hypothetical protein
MGIRTFRHRDIRTCCHDAGYDYIPYIILKNLTGNVQNKINKHGEFAGLLGRLFTLDVCSHKTFCPDTFCLSRRFVRIRFATLYLVSFRTFFPYIFRYITVNVLSLYILSLYLRSVLKTFCR